MGKDISRYLVGDEKVEYEKLLYDAAHHPDGARRKSADVGPEFRRLLIDAEQAQRPWASWVREDAELDGLRTRGIKAANARERIAVAFGSRISSKAAARGVRRRDGAGVMEHQQTLWADMYAEDLDQVKRGSDSRIAAERENAAIAVRLAALIAKTGRMPVSEALASIGMTLEQYLGQEIAS